MPAQRYVELFPGFKGGGGSTRVPIVDSLLLEQILDVEPSRDGDLLYRPCCVELASGERVDRVLVAEALPYLEHWGYVDLDDPEKKHFSILDVRRVMSSPMRLPAALADKLYRGGETSMGGISFALILRDGRRIPALTGDVVDFLEYPPGVGADDIVDVEHGYNEISPARINAAKFHTCLYYIRQ